MIRVCSGFPSSWPAAYRDRFVAAFARHWPASIALFAPTLDEGQEVETYQLAGLAAVAPSMADGDLLAWLDPDIETIGAVPSFVIPQLIKSADLCFIGREDGETDLGFWAVRLSPSVRLFLDHLGSGVSFAEARGAAGLIERDLTPGGSGDNWAHGPLGRYTQRLARPA